MLIRKESRAKPHSNPLHGSLPSGLPSQYEFRGHATPSKVRRFIAHLPATYPPITRQIPARYPPVEIHDVVQDKTQLPIIEDPGALPQGLFLWDSFKVFPPQKVTRKSQS